MYPMHRPAAPHSFRHKARSGLLAGICALAVLTVPSPAGAETTAVSPSETSITFPSARARVVGSNAVVLVKCETAESGTCSGTLTLTVAGKKHKVPFAVIGGSTQNLAIPLGDSCRAKRAFAVAQTAQETGAYVRSSETLRLR
jgi:hypothetical protein